MSAHAFTLIAGGDASGWLSNDVPWMSSSPADTPTGSSPTTPAYLLGC